VAPQFRAYLDPCRLGTSNRLIGTVLGPERPIPVPTAVGGELATDRRTMTSDPASDRGVRLAPLDPDQDLFALFEGQRAPTLLAFT
jgi:hypothetical protein